MEGSSSYDPSTTMVCPCLATERSGHSSSELCFSELPRSGQVHRRGHFGVQGFQKALPSKSKNTKAMPKTHPNPPTQKNNTSPFSISTKKEKRGPGPAGSEELDVAHFAPRDATALGRRLQLLEVLLRRTEDEGKATEVARWRGKERLKRSAKLPLPKEPPFNSPNTPDLLKTLNT